MAAHQRHSFICAAALSIAMQCTALHYITVHFTAHALYCTAQLELCIEDQYIAALHIVAVK